LECSVLFSVLIRLHVLCRVFVSSIVLQLYEQYLHQLFRSIGFGLRKI
jgi:hypothetical protein